MKSKPFWFKLSLLICLSIPLTTTAQVVEIPDPNLREKIETVLGKVSGAQITVTDMANLDKLIAPFGNIKDLTGLEGATNMTFLDLRANDISDISPLTNLTNLTKLYISNTAISDVSSLSSLTNLTTLVISNTAISEISPLAGLTNLKSLNILKTSISDLSPLSGLTNLILLHLEHNAISDLSPLVENTGLGEGGLVHVQHNPLSYFSINTHIPTLQSRGVDVKFSEQAHPALLKISGDDQKGVSGAALENPFFIEVQDANGAAVVGVSVTYTVTSGGGTLSVTSIMTDEHGRAHSTLTLGPELGANTVEVSADGVESTVTFYAIADAESPSIPVDVNGDGSVNILDLVLVASELGNTGADSPADVNGDGVVNILDLVLVAGAFGNPAAAPSRDSGALAMLTVAEVQQWLVQTSELDLTDATWWHGVLFLKQHLAALIPNETTLLPNYPNPFNPETWIPYELATASPVRIAIYDAHGAIVRRLDLGHQRAGYYAEKDRAVYWDGRNGFGERVASGLYFYTLTTSGFSATRKMLIGK